MNKNKKPYKNEVQLIVDSLRKKSKKSFAYRQKDLKKQALYFSPFYRDFIYKVINNGSLTIVQNWNKGSIIPDGDLVDTPNLKTRQKNIIYTDISRADTLPHELGHAVDFWFGHNQALSTSVVLSNGKTLKEVFTEEFEEKQEEIYKAVMDEYKNIINSNINDKAYDLLINKMSWYKKLKNLKRNEESKDVTAQRRILQRFLYNTGFVETYYQLYDKKCFASLNLKYSPILDALSSKYDFDGLFLDYHLFNYYKYSKNNDVYEFFANLFEAKVTSKHVQFDNLIKFLPKSFEAFEELFFIFYDHIQQNKRFTDIKIRKAIKNDELQKFPKQASC